MPLDVLNWRAEVRDIYDDKGRKIDPAIGRGVYRDDTDDLLSVCGPNFKPVQHQDVLAPLLDTLDAQGYAIEVRKPGRHDLYDLKGKKGCFVDLDYAANGAIMKSTIITGDFIEPTGPGRFLPDGPPTLFQRHEALNSHNQVYAAQAASSQLNLVCLNGMVNPQFTAVTKGKHTKGFSIDAFKRQILNAADLMANDAARFERYIRSALTVEQAKDFVTKTIALLAPKPDGSPNWSESLVDEILRLFNRESSRTVWGLYQAMTAWATHGQLKANSVTLTARVGRDERVARALRTPEFQQLLVA